MTELVSIIVPVYNAEHYLSECIDSILSQTYTSIEVILVDDGSTDNSGKISDDYAAKDTRITVIHQRNAGVSASRNKAIETAKGKWITFIDSDDWVEADFIESFIRNAEDESLLIQGYTKIDSQNATTIRFESGSFVQYNINELFTEKRRIINNGFAWGKLYNRDVISKHNIRFNKEICYAEDMLFMLEYILCVGKVKFLNDSKYNYRYTNGLSAKYYAYQNEYLLYVEYERLTNAIIDKYHIDNRQYIYNEGALILMRSIYTLYVNNYKRSERINKINQVRKNHIDFISSYYKPNIKLLKIGKALFLISPVGFDLFWKFKSILK